MKKKERDILLLLGSLGDSDAKLRYLCKSLKQAKQASDIWLSHAESHTAYIITDCPQSWWLTNMKNLKMLDDNFLLLPPPPTELVVDKHEKPQDA